MTPIDDLSGTGRSNLWSGSQRDAPPPTRFLADAMFDSAEIERQLRMDLAVAQLIAAFAACRLDVTRMGDPPQGRRSAARTLDGLDLERDDSAVQRRTAVRAELNANDAGCVLAPADGADSAC